MQLLLSTKLFKRWDPPGADDDIDAVVFWHKTLEASSCDNPDRRVLIVRGMREKRKSNSTTCLRRRRK
jgi:hypothetical protein